MIILVLVFFGLIIFALIISKRNEPKKSGLNNNNAQKNIVNNDEVINWKEEAMELSRKKRIDEEDVRTEKILGNSKVAEFWKLLVVANEQLPVDIRLTYENHTNNERLFITQDSGITQNGLIYQVSSNSNQIYQVDSISKYSSYDNDEHVYIFGLDIVYNKSINALVGQIKHESDCRDWYSYYAINNSIIDILLRNICLSKSKDYSDGLSLIKI